ncbi:MAG TPA: hypothetical protein VKM72_28495 [Thermoanaerobaculia bacterium]|nr:hypothetical protein [Thermoanaerobaculia bacterium]
MHRTSEIARIAGLLFQGFPGSRKPARHAASRVTILEIERPTPLGFPLLVDRLRETTLSSEKLADRVRKMQARLEKEADRTVRKKR